MAAGSASTRFVLQSETKISDLSYKVLQMLETLILSGEMPESKGCLYLSSKPIADERRQYDNCRTDLPNLSYFCRTGVENADAVRESGGEDIRLPAVWASKTNVFFQDGADSEAECGVGINQQCMIYTVSHTPPRQDIVASPWNLPTPGVKAA
jgi:hypothetical protein